MCHGRSASSHFVNSFVNRSFCVTHKSPSRAPATEKNQEKKRPKKKLKKITRQKITDIFWHFFLAFFWHSFDFRLTVRALCRKFPFFFFFFSSLFLRRARGMAFSEQGDEWEDMLGGGQEESNPFSTEEVTHTNAPGHTPHPLFDSPPAGNAPGVVSQSPNPFQSPLEVAASQNIANPLDPLQVTTPTSSSPQPSPFPPALSTPSTPQPSPSPSPASSPAPLPSSSPVAFPSSSPLGESKFQFQILEPEKIGDGMGGFVSYPITCTSTAPGWTKEEMKTARRYSEFLWLFDQLLHFDRCAIVPPLPEKVFLFFSFLFFSLLFFSLLFFCFLSFPPSYSSPLYRSLRFQVVTLSKYDKTFLKHRQTELDRFLDRVGGHPSLSLCPALKTFMTKGVLCLCEL